MDEAEMEEDGEGSVGRAEPRLLGFKGTMCVHP